mmetsp:Transcript_10077/g.24808  ORF Transcript_10077/g.24808 Transcript_10077/m.24808 type:complete len:149 (-) Transcript_10077:322-768(-)
MFSRLLRRSSRAAPSRAFRRTFAIEINNVARWASCKVASEDDAEQLDKLIVGKALPKLKDMEGFGGMRRLFCKEKLDYKVMISFEGLKNFQTFMDSEERESIQPIMQEAAKMSTTGKLEYQNFVLDRFSSYLGNEATSALKEDDPTAH